MGSPESFFGKDLHQDISGTMQEETSDWLRSSDRRYENGMQKGFVILDEVSHPDPLSQRKGGRVDGLLDWRDCSTCVMLTLLLAMSGKR